MIRVKRAALIEARIKAGFTQRAMARRLGKSSGYLSQVERGLCSVSPDSAKAIAELLGRPFEDLFEIDHPTRTA